MECEKCQDRGFTEEEHGLIRVFCDCEKGQAKRVEITGEIPDDSDNGTESDNELYRRGTEILPPGTYTRTEVVEALNDSSNSGTGQPDTIAGSGSASKPKLKRKPKIKKATRAKSG